MTIQQLADGVRTRLRTTSQHNHSVCRSRQEHQNLQQFFRDLDAMTPQQILEFRLSCPDCGCQQISTPAEALPEIDRRTGSRICRLYVWEVKRRGRPAGEILPGHAQRDDP
jgi:hypothetical protein